MLKQTLATILALGSFAAAAAASPLTLPERDWTDDVKDALVVYKNPDTFLQKVRLSAIMQYQMSAVQPNGSNSQHLKKGAAPYNDEFRRTWLCAYADFATDTQLFTWLRVGGLPTRRAYDNGRSHRTYNYFSLMYLALEQKIRAVDGLSLMVGKIQPFIGTENIYGGAELKCVERSYAAIQYDFDSNWGIDLTYRPNEADSFFFQLFANDAAHYAKANDHRDHYRDGRGFKGEFGWEDKCFTVLGASHRFGITESGYHEFSGQYAHDFNNAYHGKRRPGANCFGLGVKDILALGYDYKHDRLAVMSNIIFNFETMDGSGSNSMGFVVRPVYSLTPHIDLVARYTTMAGDGACRLIGDGTIYSQTNTGLYVDSLHAFYLGVNFYASARNQDAAKIMFGAEYTTARRDGSDCYNGWTYTCALRSFF